VQGEGKNKFFAYKFGCTSSIESQLPFEFCWHEISEPKPIFNSARREKKQFTHDFSTIIIIYRQTDESFLDFFIKFAHRLQKWGRLPMSE
jgi:hypothetical protein